MREILFRGKCQTGEWVDGGFLNRNGKPEIIDFDRAEEGDFTFCTPVEPTTVGQYTGLKDKNGKMIFEGDVVLVEKFRKGVIRYLEKEALFAVDFSSHLSRLCDTTSDYIEIIGNIHDNPELLK